MLFRNLSHTYLDLNYAKDNVSEEVWRSGYDSRDSHPVSHRPSECQNFVKIHKIPKSQIRLQHARRWNSSLRRHSVQAGNFSGARKPSQNIFLVVLDICLIPSTTSDSHLRLNMCLNSNKSKNLQKRIWLPQPSISHGGIDLAFIAFVFGATQKFHIA